MDSTPDRGSTFGTPSLPPTAGHPQQRPTLTRAHARHLHRELGKGGIRAAVEAGARSVTEAEAREMGFTVKGPDGVVRSSSGLLLPFSGDFAQLRCDKPPLNGKGEPTKYLNRAGVSQEPVKFGEGEATIATEGWKDALVIHQQTGVTTQGIAGVTGHGKLEHSVKEVVYDADAIGNPHVCRQLLKAGADRRNIKLGFFDRKIAGDKGGACEFFNNGGDFEQVRFYKPAELLTELPSLWPKPIRADWIDLSLKNYVESALDLGLSESAADALVKRACTRLGVGLACGRSLLGAQIAIRNRQALIREHGREGYQRLLDEQAQKQASKCPEEPTKQQLQGFLAVNYRLRFNELAGVVEADGVQMDKIDLADSFLADNHGIEVPKQTARDSFLYLAHQNPYNPVREYLQGLAARKDELRLVSIREIANAFGVTKGDRVSEEMLARHLIGCYRRGISPGCKHDQALVLSGHQGARKGQTIKALAPVPSWYDSATKVSSKGFEDREFLGKINSNWIFEFDEIDKILLGRDASEFKGFATREVDSYIQKWETVSKEHPRRCCIFGTTNQHETLNDHTGDRRFWIIPVGDCDPDWVRENRDSIWATVATWAAWGGLSWVPPWHPLAQRAAERAREARISEPWEGPVAARLERLQLFDENGHRQEQEWGEGIAQLDLIRGALDQIEVSRVNRDIQMAVTRIVTGAGFTTHGGRVRWQQRKRRYTDATGGVGPPRAGYMPVPVFQGVPTEPDTRRHGQTPWYDSVLKTPFQPFQPFEGSHASEQGCVDDGGDGGAEVGGGTHTQPRERNSRKKVGTGRNAPETDCGAGDPPFQPPRNGVGTAGAQGRNAGPEREEQRHRATPLRTTAELTASAIAAGVPREAAAIRAWIQVQGHTASLPEIKRALTAGGAPRTPRAAAAAPGEPFTPGDPVELLDEATGAWGNGWRVAVVLNTSTGIRVRIEELDGPDYRVVPAERLRPCRAPVADPQQEAA